MIYRILCYGDSNTWGYNPLTQGRYADDVRWTGVLQAELGSNYRVIEEGLNGRTTVWDDPIGCLKNGKTYLEPCLESQKPLDLVIIMLGTNDLKQRFSAPPTDIAAGAGILARMTMRSGTGRNDGDPMVLLVAPPPTVRLTSYSDMFAGAGEKSARFAAEYHRVAREQGCAYFDAGSVLISSEKDGIHFEAEGHAALGKALAEKVRELLV